MNHIIYDTKLARELISQNIKKFSHQSSSHISTNYFIYGQDRRDLWGYFQIKFERLFSCTIRVPTEPEEIIVLIFFTILHFHPITLKFRVLQCPGLECDWKKKKNSTNEHRSFFRHLASIKFLASSWFRSYRGL